MISKIKHVYRTAKSILREKRKSKKRSSGWNEARDKYIKEFPGCASCGSLKFVQVHHIKPFHLYPELELDGSNFITLCMGPNECHLEIGHGDNFSYYTPNIEEIIYMCWSGKREEAVKLAKENRLK